jgi:hypothetical protein
MLSVDMQYESRSHTRRRPILLRETVPASARWAGIEPSASPKHD